MLAALASLNAAQQERLSHIDFRLCFLGDVNRIDLVKRFGIKEAAATRDLTSYRELAGHNIDYHTRLKCYQRSANYQPLFDYTADQVLTALAHGLGDDYTGTQHGLLHCERPTQLNQPELHTLAILTRAIHQNRVVEIEYHSPESGKSTRTIAPHVLVDNGLRWHVRGYCRQRQGFVDFVINRIAKATIQQQSPEEHETAQADQQWQQTVELELVPHPNIKHPKAIEMDYGMVDGVKRETVRAAVAGYVLRRWNVDCTEDHSLIGAEYQLWLKNREIVKELDRLVLAPGNNE